MNSLLRVGKEALKGTISRGYATAAFPDRKVTVLGAAGNWFAKLGGGMHLWCPGEKLARSDVLITVQLAVHHLSDHVLLRLAMVIGGLWAPVTHTRTRPSRNRLCRWNWSTSVPPVEGVLCECLDCICGG